MPTRAQMKIPAIPALLSTRSNIGHVPDTAFLNVLLVLVSSISIEGPRNKKVLNAVSIINSKWSTVDSKVFSEECYGY